MKYYEIVLLILCIQVGIAFVNATDVFHASTQHDEEWFNRLMISTQDEYNQNQVQADSDSWGVGDFVKGLAIFIWNFAVGIVVVPATLGQLGLGSPFVYYISVLIYAIYIAAIAQIIANRQFKGMS